MTIVELLISTSLLAVVLTAVLGLLDGAGRAVPVDQERADSIRSAQVGLDRMVRELRQTHQVYSATGVRMDVQVQSRAGSRRVVYRCDLPSATRAGSRSCVRYEVTGGVAGPQEVVLDRVLNATPSDPVFIFDPPSGPPRFATAKVEVPAAGELAEGHKHRIVLDDGFYLRNADDGA